MKAPIEDIKAKHESQLLAIPGVVSVGIGLGVEGTPTIVIGIENETVVDQSALPQKLEGVPVRVEVVGSIHAQ